MSGAGSDGRELAQARERAAELRAEAQRLANSGRLAEGVAGGDESGLRWRRVDRRAPASPAADFARAAELGATALGRGAGDSILAVAAGGLYALVDGQEPQLLVPAIEAQEVVELALKGLLRARGIEQLYRHQVAALETARQGQDLVVVTGTASGKTLCYNLPVLNALLADPAARALYLFPTKALARGVPVVATRSGGSRELVRHEQDGLLVPPGDAGGLAEADEKWTLLDVGFDVDFDRRGIKRPGALPERIRIEARRPRLALNALDELLPEAVAVEFTHMNDEERAQLVADVRDLNVFVTPRGMIHELAED